MKLNTFIWALAINLAFFAIFTAGAYRDFLKGEPLWFCCLIGFVAAFLIHWIIAKAAKNTLGDFNPAREVAMLSVMVASTLLIWG